MDPSYWELDPEEPPAYEDLSIAEDKKAIEAPPDEDDDEDETMMIKEVVLLETLIRLSII